jgi:hypothetical protein
MKTRALLGSLSLLAVAFVACDVSNSPPLPGGYNQAVTRAFTVRLDTPVNGAGGLPARLRPFNGVDGSSLAPTGQNPLPFSQQAGVKVLRYPRGWGCQLTLDAVFPDPTADPTRSASYSMEGLQSLTVELAARSIVPMWQTIYDIGLDQGSCTSTEGVATGGRIGDVDTWATVVTGVTDRLSRATAPYFTADATARLALQRLHPGYVEFLPDALATANYAKGGLSSLLPVYVAWRRAFDVAFPDGGATRIQATVGPSLPAAGPDDVTTKGTLLGGFLDYIRQQSTLAPEVLSFLSNTSTPEQHLALVKATRAALDGMGLTGVQIADTGLRLPEATWASLSKVYDTTARRSAYLGAYLAMVKVLEQDDLDLLVADRWGGPLPTTVGAVTGEDLFQSADGQPLPALLSLSPFARMDADDATRIAVETVPWPDPVTEDRDVIGSDLDARDAVATDAPKDAAASAALPQATTLDVVADATARDAATDAADADVPDAGTELPLEGDTLRVLAARTKTGGLTAVVVSLPPVSPAQEGVRMRYQLDVEGVPLTPLRWILRRYHVDATSNGFRGPVEQSVVIPVAGHVRIVRDITGPAIDQLELVPETTTP